MAADNFWTNAGPGIKDPKRQYRFLVYLEGMEGGATWYAKSAKKPEITITTVEHNYLNHKFYYPGRTEWGEVQVVLVDPVSPDAAAETAAIIQAAGYHPPVDATDVTTMSKSEAVKNLLGVRIVQIDSTGVELEAWALKNAFITSVSYGDLDYSGDDLTEVTIGLRYDWAELTSDVAAEGKKKFFNQGGS